MGVSSLMSALSAAVERGGAVSALVIASRWALVEEEAAKAARETLRKQKRQERRDTREHRIKVLREKFSRA